MHFPNHLPASRHPSAAADGAPAARPDTSRRAWLAAGATAVLGLAVTGAQAQPHEDWRGRGKHRGRDDRRGPDDRRSRDDRQGWDDRRGPPGHRSPAGHGRPIYGTGPQRGWHRGDRVPPQYRGRQYVVHDWRAHRLGAPPRGYHWVQYGADYMLVAIATGVIVQLILAH